MGEINSSAHSKWRCQYHIIFAPKFRRKEIYGKLKADIGEILRKLCEQKKVEILEAEACPDHIHMLVSIPPHLSVSQFMGFLKGKSTLMHGHRIYFFQTAKTTRSKKLESHPASFRRFFRLMPPKACFFKYSKASFRNTFQTPAAFLLRTLEESSPKVTSRCQ